MSKDEIMEITGPATTSWGKKMIARVDELEKLIRKYQKMVVLDTKAEL